MFFNILIFVSIASFAFGCPQNELLHPCTCDWDPMNNEIALVTCDKLNNNHDLTSAVSSMIGKNYIHRLTIINSAFDYIPSTAFEGLKFNELAVVNSTLRALTDTKIAFQGMEDQLQTLTITDCNIFNEWDWRIFRNMKKLGRIFFTGGNVENVENMGNLQMENLRQITLSHQKINYIDENAFADLKTLTYLKLHHNEIKEVKRSMLPNPAKHFLTIDLSNNKIEKLPEDLFTNMPVLDQILLENNQLLFLDEKVFAPIWDQVEFLVITGNELRCDCRMTWILKKEFPIGLDATCHDPSRLKGKQLKTLTSQDLFCSFSDDKILEKFK